MKWIFGFAPYGKNEFATDMMPTSREASLLFGFAVLAGFICFLVFWIFPNLDLDVVRAFANENGTFYLGADPVLSGLRKAVLFILFFFYVLVIGGGLDAFKHQRPVLGFTWEKWAYLGACAMLGPVLLVNVILKGNWGRARPKYLEEFGGSLDFTPFWVWADQCRDNCSFTSGEVAGVVMVLFSIAFVLGAGVRYVIFAITVLVAAFIAWIRFAMGAHFPSDTVMSVVLMLLVAVQVYCLFFLSEARWISKLNQKQLAKLEHEAADPKG
ncbi:MAG: phosphatase PAP2 family protein [Pseudomonadota bacterium]